MKKVPAISTSDSRAVLGWPQGLICPDFLAELLLFDPRVVSSPADVIFSLRSTSGDRTAVEWVLLEDLDELVSTDNRAS